MIVMAEVLVFECVKLTELKENKVSICGDFFKSNFFIQLFVVNWVL